jgi:hypothetical protein
VQDRKLQLPLARKPDMWVLMATWQVIRLIRTLGIWLSEIEEHSDGDDDSEADHRAARHESLDATATSSKF